jgi:hypothetical protein
VIKDDRKNLTDNEREKTMTKIEFQIVEMLGRVVAFGEANEDKFPKTSLVWPALASMRSGISKTYELAALQQYRSVSLCTDARQTARDTLTALLDAIHQTSFAVAIDVPQTDMFFRLPGFPRRDGEIIDAGMKFAKHAEPLKAAFVDHHLPEDFIEKLKEAIQNFQQAIDKQRLAKNDRTRASAQIAETIEEALTDLQRVESIVRNTLRNDSAALTAWEAARHVTRVRRSKAAKPDADKAGDAAPAGGEAAVAIATSS